MAGKGGGGSWKVAYADFVTAMMAFFLVMWIGAQDQKVRQSVANYFVDPSGVDKKPVRTGAVSDALSYGSVPQNESVAMGKGRDSHTRANEFSPLTKKVFDWINADPKRLEEFKKLAQECRAEAKKSPEVTKKGMDPEVVASHQLAVDVKVKVGADLANTSGLYQDLLIEAMNDVNWQELAEDLLGR